MAKIMKSCASRRPGVRSCDRLETASARSTRRCPLRRRPRLGHQRRIDPLLAVLVDRHARARCSSRYRSPSSADFPLRPPRDHRQKPRLVLEQIAECRTRFSTRPGRSPMRAQLTEQLIARVRQRVLTLSRSLERYSNIRWRVAILAAAKTESLSFPKPRRVKRTTWPRTARKPSASGADYEPFWQTRGAEARGAINSRPVAGGLECVVAIDQRYSGGLALSRCAAGREPLLRESFGTEAFISPASCSCREIVSQKCATLPNKWASLKSTPSSVRKRNSPSSVGKRPQAKTSTSARWHQRRPGHDGRHGWHGDRTEQRCDRGAAGVWSWTTHSTKWMSSCTSVAGCGYRSPERCGRHGAEHHRHGLRRHGAFESVSGAITQEVIDVLAVLNALRAAFPPTVSQCEEIRRNVSSMFNRIEITVGGKAARKALSNGQNVDDFLRDGAAHRTQNAP